MKQMAFDPVAEQISSLSKLSEYRCMCFSATGEDEAETESALDMDDL